MNKGPLALSLLIITIGIGWLLTVLGYGVNVDWIWTLSLAVIGVLTFILSGGVDKLSVVIGPFFLIGSVLSLLRQTGTIHINIEIPILVIVMGILIFVAQLRCVPSPGWFVPLTQDRE